MDRLVDHLFVFEGEGEVRDFPGNYSQYREWQKQQEILAEIPRPEPAKAAPVSAAPKKKLSYKEQREFEMLEKEIQELENERKTIEKQLSYTDLPFEKLQQYSERINAINILIDEKEFRWLELSEVAS
jgi:ATP-binding cassette subfamily F protein uup